MNKNSNSNPCLYCDCYDPDMGCTMPSVDKSYACSLEDHKPLEFFLLMKIPTTTHQEKQISVVKGKPIIYEPQELKVARAKFIAHLAAHKPKEKYIGAVQLVTKWIFPITGTKHENGDYKTTKPDTDNLVKLFKDCMTHVGFWKDDAQVASEVIEKFWGNTPGIWVSVREL